MPMSHTHFPAHHHQVSTLNNFFLFLALEYPSWINKSYLLPVFSQGSRTPTTLPSRQWENRTWWFFTILPNGSHMAMFIFKEAGSIPCTKEVSHNVAGNCSIGCKRSHFFFFLFQVLVLSLNCRSRHQPAHHLLPETSESLYPNQSCQLISHSSLESRWSVASFIVVLMTHLLPRPQTWRHLWVFSVLNPYTLPMCKSQWHLN